MSKRYITLTTEYEIVDDTIVVKLFSAGEYVGTHILKKSDFE